MRCSFRVLALVSILGFAGKLSAQVADPAPRPVLAYEGRLVESNTFVTGLRTFVFSVIDSNGNELWNSRAQTLTVTSGLYGVVLGSAGMPGRRAQPERKAQLERLEQLGRLGRKVPPAPVLSHSMARMLYSQPGL